MMYVCPSQLYDVCLSVIALWCMFVRNSSMMYVCPSQLHDVCLSVTALCCMFVRHSSMMYVCPSQLHDVCLSVTALWCMFVRHKVRHVSLVSGFRFHLTYRACNRNPSKTYIAAIFVAKFSGIFHGFSQKIKTNFIDLNFERFIKITLKNVYMYKYPPFPIFSTFHSRVGENTLNLLAPEAVFATTFRDTTNNRGGGLRKQFQKKLKVTQGIFRIKKIRVKRGRERYHPPPY